MGSERSRFWFPLALLGFAQLVVVAFSFGRSRSEGWPAYLPPPGEGRYQSPHGVEMSRDSAVALNVSVGVGRNDGWLFAVLVVYLGTVLFYAVKARRAGSRPRWWKVLAIAVGGLVTIGLADLTGYWEFHLAGDVRSALLVTLGLVLLAWLERSVLVLVVAAAFVLCAVVLAQGRLALLLSSLVALAGAFVALLNRPKTAAEGT